MNDLGSLVHRDEGANGGIRVRHLSTTDFLISNHCAYHASERCFSNTVSLSVNSEIPGSLMQENISDALQYSFLYWWNHLSLTPDNGNL